MEIFLTLSLAFALSFLVAKLVSIAVAGGCFSELKSANISSRQDVVEELRFGDRLCVSGFESERKVQCVEADVEKIDECVGVSAHSPDIVEVHPERKNEEETSQSSADVEKSGWEEEFVPLLLTREVSDYESLDHLKKFDDPELKLSEQINIDDSMMETIKKRNDEKIGVGLKNDVADFCQTKEVMDKEDNAQELILDGEDDDDDWEGIERSEIENVFAAASKFVGLTDIENRMANLGKDLRMEFYGLHKAATEGPCREPQPVPLKVSARAKWNAWQRLGNISPDEAMEQYISLLSNTFPLWMDSAGQSRVEPLEAETPNTFASSSTHPNSLNESKAEIEGDERDAHVGDLHVKNKVEG